VICSYQNHIRNDASVTPTLDVRMFVTDGRN